MIKQYTIQPRGMMCNLQWSPTASTLFLDLAVSPAQRLFTSILYNALAEPIGLLCWSPDSAKARMALYQARVKAADPTLAILQIRLLNKNELVVCHPVQKKD